MKLRATGAAFCLLLSHFTAAQHNSPKASYEDLLKQIELHQGTEKVWIVLREYITKARSENNRLEIVAAYKEMLHECDEPLQLAYADSLIVAAKQTGIRDLIGDAYLSKGIIYYKGNHHQQALDNYIFANTYLCGTQDAYLKFKVKYSIAQIKYYLGYYHEAISLFTECAEYFKAEEPLPYLKSLHCLTICYIFTGNLELARSTNSLTLSESTRLGIKDMLPYIESTLGIINYKSRNYGQAMKNFGYALPQIRRDNDFANEAVAHFYLGSTYWAAGSEEKAVAQFKAVDSIFTAKNFIRPDMRRTYEFLIRYYYHKGRPNLQLRYIEQLIKADSLLEREFTYLSKKIHKEYDTAELIAEKEKIQGELHRSHWSLGIFKILIMVLALTVVYLFFRHRRLQRIHRLRFQELISSDRPQPAVKIAGPYETNINPVIVDHILSRLSEFERKRNYLKKDISATMLAQSFDTNYKYLSKVIRVHREKSFVNYINDLRIDYLVERLKVEPLLRRYSNGALAGEAGFSTAQHFTTAFKKRTGISATFFNAEYDKLELESAGNTPQHPTS